MGFPASGLSISRLWAVTLDDCLWLFSISGAQLPFSKQPAGKALIPWAYVFIGGFWGLVAFTASGYAAITFFPEQVPGVTNKGRAPIEVTDVRLLL
jgi:hypothetical protein